MEIKELSENGLTFLVMQEGLRLRAYQDQNGIWTIGVGCTYFEDGRRVKKGDILTKTDAINLFKTIVKHYEKAVWSFTRDDINQNQFDALTSFCFNVGIKGFQGSTLLKLVNRNPYNPAIVVAFKMWQNSGQHKGILLARRELESQLYFS